MKKIITKILLSTIFFTSFSCSQPKPDPFVLSHLPHIQPLEKQDHSFCSSLKIAFDKSDNLKSGLYWRCRLSLTKYRLYTDNSRPENAKHNLEISDLITKISLRLSDTPESILMRENKKMDDRQHQQCLALGFVIATEDQAKIDDYFSCRRALIEEQRLSPPFGNSDYLQYPNRSYDIGFAIDRRVDEEIKQHNAAKEKYPTCAGFNLNSLNFKNCTIAQDRSRQCFSEIEKKKFKKEAEEKTICQKQSYIEFSDDFLKEDDLHKKDIARMKTNSDFYNQYSFASIGVDDTQFTAENKDAKLPSSQRGSTKKINSKAELYSKFELTKLRQKYIFSCQQEADSRIASYVADLKKSCEDSAKFEIIGEN
jgi:hypothetical protein